MLVALVAIVAGCGAGVLIIGALTRPPPTAPSRPPARSLPPDPPSRPPRSVPPRSPQSSSPSLPPVTLLPVQYIAKDADAPPPPADDDDDDIPLVEPAREREYRRLVALSQQLLAASDHAGVVAALTRAMRIQILSPIHLHRLASAQLDIDRPRDAIETCQLMLQAAADPSSRVPPQAVPPLLQGTWNLIGQAHQELHEWPEASLAFAHQARMSLRYDAWPMRETRGCADGGWRLMEAWVDTPGVTVSELPPPLDAAEAFVDALSGKTYDDAARAYKLVHLRDAQLDSPNLGRLYQPAPVSSPHLEQPWPLVAASNPALPSRR